ncbi:DUF2894 domain-containing protein [Dyella choica]|uniref:DUF2894 domain-containing protein n=2 Tax=Dyella choica TaxID=1927959 RepID=A0A432MB12_9GAMM|nr:DUF2894 domain-containing protein [Dyella choica]
MSHSRTHARVTLDAWRKQRADRMNPVRFQFIEAMERRAASHTGEVRRLLDDKLSELLDAYASDLEKAADNATAPCPPERGALGVLIDHIASHAAARSNELAAKGVPLYRHDFPSLGMLDEFRKIWSQVRAQSQLLQSLEPVPAHAGPLNSSALVHRSITLMREWSPEYLQHFLSYVDDLSWMAQMNAYGVSAVPAKDAPPNRSARKRAADK